MTIAVTGATGFIGRHVVAELLRRGLSPVLVRRRGSSISSEEPEHVVAEWNIGDPPARAFAAIGRPTALIHLAWGGLPHYASRHHFEDELPNHYLFLKSLIEAGLENCVVAGTCLEYGMQSGELSEDCIPRPTTPYGFAKDCLRRQLEILNEHQRFALTWARLFYTYGEGQPVTSLYPQLKAAAARGDTCFDMSGGEQLRDYLPVQEIARLLVALALRETHAGVVNVCAGHPISIRRLVERWIAENGWSLRLNLGRYPYTDYEPMAFWGSRRKLETLVGELPE